MLVLNQFIGVRFIFLFGIDYKMKIDKTLMLNRLNSNNLFLHEVNGRVSRDIMANYDKNHSVNHSYNGRETHFVMNCDGVIVFIGNLHELNGFLAGMVNKK